MRPTPLLRMRPTTTLRLHASRSTRQNMPARTGQDLPPTEGYEPVQYKRNLPARGFRPIWYFLATGVISLYGLFRWKTGIHEWNELAREKMWSRIHLIPLLQAEEDRDQVRRYWADQERERQLLGSNTKVYNSDRFVRPYYSIAPYPGTPIGGGEKKDK